MDYLALQVRRVGSLEAAAAVFRELTPEVVVIDLGADDALRQDAVRFIRRVPPNVIVVAVSRAEDESSALDCLRAGAADCYFISDVSCLRAGVELALQRRHCSPRDLCAAAERQGGKVLAAEVFPTLEAVDQGLRRLRDRIRDDDVGMNVQQLRAKLIRMGSLLGEHLSGVGEQFESGGESALSDRHGILTRCSNMERAVSMCVRVAPTRASVLLLGETGTGKELLARAIHAESSCTGDFVPINCGAVPEHLIESLLFGHERGAFTGAHTARQGLFQMAAGGTLFLDEVGNMPPACQVSTLRALQERRIRPVGGSHEVPVDLRVVAATSTPLDDAVDLGTFRADLLYRLDVVRVELPPLRERRGDVEALLHHFAPLLADKHGLPVPELRSGFLAAAREFDWPGNVRQLANLVERLLFLSDGPFDEQDFVRALGSTRLSLQVEETRSLSPPDGGSSNGLEGVTNRAEAHYLRVLLQQHAGRVEAVATSAGVSARTITRKLKKYGLQHGAN